MRQQRYIPPHQLVEVTCRTTQGRALLCPSHELNRRFVGVLGRAQSRWNMIIHAIIVLSNHVHYLLSPESGEQLSAFMQFVQTNLSKEIGDLHDWEGTLWADRFTSILVSDEDEAQIDRLRYLLANGVKEDLVARVRDWPGVGSAPALVDGEKLRGVWYDRSKLYELNRSRRRGGAILEDVAEPETVVLSPLPCWKDLPETEVRERVAALVEAIDHEAAERRKAEGTGVLGPRRVRKCDPHARPKKRLEKSPAPRFHVASQEAWNELRDAYDEFVARFREAAECLKRGLHVPFPPGSFPPGAPFVPHAALG